MLHTVVDVSLSSVTKYVYLCVLKASLKNKS